MKIKEEPMKKIIAVILALTMLLALAACTAKTETTTTDTAADAATTTDTAAEQPADTEAEQPTDTNGDVTTITLAMHVSNTQEQEPAVYQAIQAFQQENPDVKIELVEHLTEEHNKQLKLWAQSGELPDIFWCQEGDVLEYGENGYLLPLNDFLSQNPDIDSAIPDAIKNCYAGENGEIYGLAYTSLVTGFYYNKAIFADNGLPELTNETTYEELLDMVKTLHDNGVTTFAQGAMTNYSVWGYLGSLNRYGYAENIAAIADGSQSSAVFSKLFDKLAELGAAGAYPQNMATIDYFEASNQFANCPFVVSADVAKDEAKQAAVYRFLAFYFGQEGSSILFDNSNIPIATYADLQMENTNPAFAAISEALATGYASTTASNPVASLTASVSETFYDAMNSLMLGNITTEQAVASIDTAFAEAAQ